jgi:hypothetical protein
MSSLFKNRNLIPVILIFFICLIAGIFVYSNDSFKFRLYAFNSEQKSPESDKGYDFFIADAKDNTCQRGAKRCLGDVPQRCDNGNKGIEYKSSSEPLEYEVHLADDDIYFPFGANDGVEPYSDHNKRTLTMSELGLGELSDYSLHKDNLEAMNFDIYAITYSGSETEGDTCWEQVEQDTRGFILNNNPNELHSLSDGGEAHLYYRNSKAEEDCSFDSASEPGCTCTDTTGSNYDRECYVFEFSADNILEKIHYSAHNDDCYHPHRGIEKVTVSTKEHKTKELIPELGWHNILTDDKGCSDMGKVCLNGECVDGKNIDLLTQPQPYNINTPFYKGGISANTIKADSVIDEWERLTIDNNINWDNNPGFGYYYARDFYYDPDRVEEYVATSSNKMWVGDNLGEKISHCPNINEGKNYSKQINLPANGHYQSCGYTFGPSDFPRLDYGQNCHRDRWQAWGDNSFPSYSSVDSYDSNWTWLAYPAVDVGTAYKDCLYNNYSGGDFDYIAANSSCNPYEGGTANVDCQAIATAATEGPNSAKVTGNPTHTPPPVHPNECIPGPYGDGVWDWYNQRPDCTYFEPDFKRERVCLEIWDDCVPIEQGECRDLNCSSDSINIGNCIQRSVNNSCYCPNPTGSPPGEFSLGWYKRGTCSMSGEISSTQQDSGCERCDGAENSYTCNTNPYNQSECTNSACSFSNNCSCDWDGCQKGYKPCLETECTEKECTEYNEEDECISEECVSYACTKYGSIQWSNMDCEYDIDIPEDYTYHEAEDCCKKWYWKCSAGCVSQTEDCFEGYAVGHRGDYRYATFNIGGASGDCDVSTTHQFTIKLFTGRNSTSKNTEEMIRNATEGLYSPHYEYTENEFEGKVEQNCSRTTIGSLKDHILVSGELVSGDEVDDPGMANFDLEEYLSSFSGKYIRSIIFKKTIDEN